MKADKIRGSICGLALGDAFGAPYEGGIPERVLWSVIGKTRGKRRWTDDTQMTIDVVESLLEHGRVDQDDLARRFGHSYRWSRGYGRGAARILKRIRRGQPWEAASRSVFREGSYGNGGAMRAPVVGLFFAGAGEYPIIEAAKAIAAVTHAHPLGQEGAALIALTTALASQDVGNSEIFDRLREHVESPKFAARLEKAEQLLQAQDPAPPREVAAQLGNRIAAVDSCVTAIYIARAFCNAPFGDLLTYTITIGGDVDTIAAMAGAIWGAARGLDALPKGQLAQLEQYDRIESLAQSFAKAITR